MAKNSFENPIVIRGARAHNLKNITVTIPQNSLTVITGLSGSGKSSLAFDTLYAEGQRRYVESLSTYARQFLGQMDKADVDGIDGLSPAIAIEQRTTQRNPRSTVGTVTEIYDHLRLLWARVGIPHCPKCGRQVVPMPAERIVETVIATAAGEKIAVLAPIASAKKGTFKKELEDLRKAGFLKAKIDGEIVSLEEEPELLKSYRHDVDGLVDRFVVSEDDRTRLNEAVELALKVGNGVAAIEKENGNGGVDREIYSEAAACPECGIGFEPLDPKHFSFNSPHGACSACAGLGVHYDVDPEKVIVDKKLSINEGCIAPWGENPRKKWFGRALPRLAEAENFSLDTPWGRLPAKVKKLVLEGPSTTKGLGRRKEYRWRRRKFEGVIPNLRRRYLESESTAVREWVEGFMTLRKCEACEGERLRETSRAVRVAGRRLPELLKETVHRVDEWLDTVTLGQTERRIAQRLVDELRSRLGFLQEVGLDYLSLERSAATLSGGEAQRIRLATQLGSRLRGVLYVLDEPSIGLHPADTEKLLRTLRDLRDLGNTVVVVEHDRETIEAADYVIDMGPAAGRHGGEVVVEGTPKEIIAHESSLTGAYLSGRRMIEHHEVPRPKDRGFIEITDVNTNNLKNVSARLPIANLICVTGVSGSGKSSLIMDTLFPAMLKHFGMRTDPAGPYKSLRGMKEIDKAIGIDQSPIGRTSRSNPATYTGVFTPIRDLFSRTREARARGYKPGRFSFNVKGGRCEVCQGAGVKVVEMHFLPDVYIECEACSGKRYNTETLEVKYKGKSIADVLEMTIDEAKEFFWNIPQAKKWLEMLTAVGLGYLQVGQSATTLSGGEAQRLKLASELGKTSKGRTLYILDEPTTGLHIEDVRILMTVLDRLVDRGDTVLIVEHHPDVMAHCDYIVDLGPGSGERGGEIVAAGSPREIADCKKSLTGQALIPLLGN